MSVNKVILIGNVGKDPDVRVVSGNKVANLTLATSEKAYSKQDGTQVPERTEWHSLVVWGKLAEICENYIRKGSKIYVEGKIRTRSYDKDGQKRYVTEVFVDSMEMLDRPQQQTQNQQSAPQGYPQQYQGYQQPPQAYPPQQAFPQQGYAPQGYPTYPQQAPIQPEPQSDGLPF